MVVSAASFVHLAGVRIEERRVVTTGDGADGGHGVDLKGTLRVVRGVPGLLALIAFSCFNNFIGGAFMAVMDPYGLELVSVQAWGLLWGVLWTVCIVFPLKSSIVLLVIAVLPLMLVMPYAEAAEQTILQRVVPYERQGRVFGFAQSVEQAASPLTAFLVAPLTQFVMIPFMTDGAGARWIGPWFGTGPDRGMALVFIATGVIGLVVTGLALVSRPYRQLSEAYHDKIAASGTPDGSWPS